MSKRTVGKILTLISLVILFLLLWWAQGNLNPYIRRIINLIGINIIWAVTFNLVFGYTGQLSLGHAGLIAVGAYTTAILTMSPAQKEQNFFFAPMIAPLNQMEWPFLPALIVAALLAAAVGFLIGLPSLQFRGDYMAIVTLGLAEIIRVVNMNLQRVTNGALGLKGIPSYTSLLWTGAAVVITVAFISTLVKSSYGRAFMAVRDDELAAEAMGVNAFRHKMMAFVIASFFIGIGGGLYACLLSTIDPNVFIFLLSYQVVTIVVLGGVGSITGNVLGSVLYVSLFELLRPIDGPFPIGPLTLPGRPGMRMVVFSLIFLVVILFYRRGLMGTNEFSWNWLLTRLGIWRKSIGVQE